jgi:hypothetical protein
MSRLSKEKKRIIYIYISGVEKNLVDISNILASNKLTYEKNLYIYKKTLKDTSEKVIDKWEKGEKYLRTEFVLQAFGKKYPEKMLEISVTTDAMINILDDIFDKDLKKKEKLFYILEYLRVFALYGLLNPKAEITHKMGNYIDKLITLALAEFEDIEKFSRRSIDERIESFKDLLLLRSMDIDIFIEMALSNGDDKRMIDSIKRSGRVFRAINILKKDIHDIAEDIDQGQDTIVLLFKKDSSNYKKSIKAVISKLENELSEMRNHMVKSKNSRLEIGNFIKMFKSEKLNIEMML